MSLIPDETVNTLRSFNDLAVELYGIDCTVYVAMNLNELPGLDMYLVKEDINYYEYLNQKVWVEWAPKNMERLRKLGVFAQDEAPILAWFKMRPDLTIGTKSSYVKIPVRYIPDNYSSTDEFEIVNINMPGIYSSEIYRCYKLAPRREKV